MASTKKLQDHNWADVEEWAASYIQIDISSDDGEEAGAAAGVVGASVRANINID